jgi:hypothetical protein
MGKNGLNQYYDSLLEGAKVKELVKVLLEKSGYTVYPYGYETTFSDVRKKMNSETARNSRTARRIRSSPDLLVYEAEKNDVSLVEVKMRRAPTETKILIYAKLISAYKEFWNDSILIVVVPCGHIFYAQRVSELTAKESYNAVRDFQKLEEIFCKVSEEDLSHFRAQALQIMEK